MKKSGNEETKERGNQANRLEDAVKGERVFLSGPMTGMPDWNRAAFEEAERIVRGAGAKDVYNPANNAPARKDANVYAHSEYMLMTLGKLTEWTWQVKEGRAVPAAWYGALVLLDGWWRSDGATRERMVAQSLGIEVYELSELVRGRS